MVELLQTFYLFMSAASFSIFLSNISRPVWMDYRHSKKHDIKYKKASDILWERYRSNAIVGSIILIFLGFSISLIIGFYVLLFRFNSLSINSIPNLYLSVVFGSSPYFMSQAFSLFLNRKCQNVSTGLELFFLMAYLFIIIIGFLYLMFFT